MIGGNVSTNAGGIRLLRYGSLHGSVLGLEVVTGEGKVMDTLYSMRKDNTGFDLKQLFIGAEGSLGVVTKVAMHVPPLPKNQSVCYLACDNFEDILGLYRLARQELSEILSAFEVQDSYTL
mmetsp:Transcript_31898/g.5774  ORF Transcript_31898/g.5774 Transcript_31898/m.5774 type:complete len:121 (+) Transcript_31898:494-856(+)